MIIDCDIHAEVREHADLLPYMSLAWRKQPSMRGRLTALLNSGGPAAGPWPCTRSATRRYTSTRP